MENKNKLELYMGRIARSLENIADELMALRGEVKQTRRWWIWGSRIIRSKVIPSPKEKVGPIASHQTWLPPVDFDQTVLDNMGFEDSSWHNDAMPSFTNEETGYVLWVDYPREESEFGDSKNWSRYTLCQRTGLEPDPYETEQVMESDSFGEVMVACATKMSVFVKKEANNE